MVIDNRSCAVHEGFNGTESSRPVNHVGIESRIKTPPHLL
jgi:hypothetical protein